MKTRDGNLIWVHSRSAPRYQLDGTTVWDGIMQDITRERQIAEALRQAKETAEAAERAKSDFLATMSHEIRTADEHRHRDDTADAADRSLAEAEKLPGEDRFFGEDFAFDH